MREPVSFFTPVSYGNLHTSKLEKLLEFVDDGFFFGGHKAVLVSPRSSLEPSQRVELKLVQTSMWKTSFKVVVWLACFVGTVWNPLVWSVPVGLLALKVVCRMKRSFHIELQDDVLGKPRSIQIHSAGSFQKLRNHEPTSDVQMIPFQEGGLAASGSIHAHSHLLTEFFQVNASSLMLGGLDEKGDKKLLDWSKLPHATPKNIHQFLDYQYGLDIQQKWTLHELLSLFEFADYVLAHDLKKKILELLQQMPEARKSPEFIPVLRNMFLFPALTDHEFDLLLEWFMTVIPPSSRPSFANESVKQSATNGDVRALLLLVACTPSEKKHEHLQALLNKQEHPLVQDCLSLEFYWGRPGIPRDEEKSLQFLQNAVNQGVASAKASLGILCRSGGGGVSKDLNRAMELAEESALAGSLKGIELLGDLSRGNQTLLRNSEKVFECVSRAERVGSSYGKLLLAECYRLGTGTKTDKVRALDLYIQWMELPHGHGPNEKEEVKNVQHWIQVLAAQ